MAVESGVATFSPAVNICKDLGELLYWLAEVEKRQSVC